MEVVPRTFLMHALVQESTRDGAGMVAEAWDITPVAQRGR
jgi:hypothetical protein